MTFAADPDRDDREDSSRELSELAAGLTGFCADAICDELNIALGPDGTYRPAYAEEARMLGYRDEDPQIILFRKPAGPYFAVELAAHVRRLPAPAASGQPRQGEGPARLCPARAGCAAPPPTPPMRRGRCTAAAGRGGRSSATATRAPDARSRARWP